jgi:hypothetical protein
MYPRDVQGSTVQVGVKTCHHTNKGVEAIFSSSTWNNVGLAFSTKTQRKMPVLRVMQLLPVSVAEGPQSSPSSIADRSSVGG